MFCLKNITTKSVCRVTRSCRDWSLGISVNRASAKFSKSVDLGKRNESDNLEQNDNLNIAHKVSAGLPLALQYFPEEVETSASEIELFEKSKAEFEDTLEDIKFDIENLKSLKKQFESEDVDKKSPNEVLPMSLLVGTPDLLHKPSTVPCGGCGAFLHCNDPSIPGYITQEQFKGKTKAMLSTWLCQRCRLMKWGKVLELDVDKKGYAKVVKQIKKEKALVVMVVDVTDMANSIIPEFLDSVGRRRPIFIVGNKIDLYPKDDKGYLNRILQRLQMECERASLNPSGNNIKYMSLVSAKTGYGIEELINRLISWWGVSGDVYLVGTTNSGKSTLFNKFLSSDYCKHTCRDIAQRATVSRWPGTTLNLIQFPIIKPYGWKMGLRVNRLKEDRMKDVEKEMRRKEMLKKYGGSKNARLTAKVGMTEFRKPRMVEEENKRYETTGQHFTTFSFNSDGSDIEAKGFSKTNVLDERKTVLHDLYPDAKWAHDTPGMVNPNQLFNYLTAGELKLLLHRNMIRPRVYVLRPGHVMFITGLARIDYLEGGGNTFFTVHTNHFLPVHVVNDTEADEFYRENFNTETLALPTGSKDRLNHFPSLCGKEFFIQTEDHSMAAADLQLSSLGWVSFAGKNKLLHIRAYMPSGRGMRLRTPSVLPNISAFKGKRISETNKGYFMKKLRA